MNEHTPGPWTLAAQDTAVFAPTLAKPLAWRLSKANAHLIAAAPDLLDALRTVQKQIQPGAHPADITGALLTIRAAIAKAGL